MVNNPLVRSAEEVLDPQAPLSQAFRDAVSAEISDFLSEQSSVLDSMGPELVPLHLMASQMLCGGKRMRPPSVSGATLLQLEILRMRISSRCSLLREASMYFMSALIHDDLMDSSDLRRGRPAAHRQFEALHANAGWLGDSAAFGRAGAILLGDLLLMWSAQMLHSADVDQSALERALPIVEAMRTEVTCGQYLDMVAQAHPLRSGPGDRGAEAHYRTGIGRRQPSRGVQGRAIYRAAALPDRRRNRWRRRRAVLRPRRLRLTAGSGLPVPG